MRLLHIIVDGILADSFVLLPVTVFLGLVIARTTLLQAAGDAISVGVGWLGIAIGLWGVSQALGGFDALLAILLERAGSARRAEFDPSPTLRGDWAHAQAFAILLAYIVNIAWARFTRARYLFLNPVHVLLATAMLLLLFARGGIEHYVAIAATAALVGSAMAWVPFLGRHWHELLDTEHKGLALGSFHTGILIGVALAAERLFKSKRTRENVPEGDDLLGGGLLGSPVLFSGLLIGGMSLLLAVNAGEDRSAGILRGVGPLALLPRAGGDHYLVGALLLGVVFAAGLWIFYRCAPLVLSGLASALGGLTKGLPGVKVAVDGLFILPEAPRAASIGFLLSLAGGLAGYYLFDGLGLRTTVPGMLIVLSAGHLVGGGAAGVIARRIGGNRALYILAPAHGLVLSLITGLAMTASTGLGGNKGIAVELSDLSALGALLAAAFKMGS